MVVPTPSKVVVLVTSLRSATFSAPVSNTTVISYRLPRPTPGFVDQNADLTGSKLEVVRKLGEGCYAVVYLVRR